LIINAQTPVELVCFVHNLESISLKLTGLTIFLAKCSISSKIFK